MFSPPRVLYVTISNWGVGDELALTGTMQLMREVLPGHLTLFAEKNEAVRAMKDAPYKWDIWSSALHAPNIDLIVHAGGNQWTGPNHAAWEDRIIKAKVPVLYMGVGMFNPKADLDKTRSVLKHCRMFVGRDHVAVSKAKALGYDRAVLGCCPSLFVAPVASGGKGVGLVYQARQKVAAHSCGPDELATAQHALIQRVSEAYPTRIICHYIGDFADAVRRFPKFKDRIVYSRILSDYIEWYASCEKIMSMRLHGAYLGATLGKPTVCLKVTNGKCCALPVIGVPVVHPKDARADDKGKFSNPAQTEALKAKFLAQYHALLRGVFA